jgi:signal transduction histidine kinase/AmiR/NasT family two-component response regulator
MKDQASERPEGAVSFESRIAAVALLTAVAVLITASGAFIVEQWRAEKVINDRTYGAIASMLVSDAATELARSEPEDTQNVFAALGQLPKVQSADLVDDHGKIIFRYVRPPNVKHHVLDVEVRRSPVIADGKQIGEVVLRSDAPTIAGILPRYVAVGGALFFVAAGMALFLGRWLAGRVTKPVARLATAMEEITGSSNDYNRRVEPMYDDEVGKLTESFNELLQRLHINDSKLRQTMDDLVEARDQAEAANVLKSHFLANMSHEIRTPLNGVLAMAQIMAMSDLTEQQRERLDVIRKSGESLLAVLNDILDLSKIEAGRMELEPAPFETASTIRQAFASFAGMAEKKGLEFSIDVDPMAEGWRLGDAARVCQIVNNLTSNAIKFTEKGQVSLRIEPEGDDGEAGFRLLITDTGMGIAPDKQSYMFEKFSQLDGSATRRFGGTGLGLAICRELAQLMGGEITVKSVVGEGSTFTVTLPLQRVVHEEQAPVPAAAAQAADAHAEDAEDERPLRVLAAEDNATNQLVLRTVMQTFGADLTMVGDGKQAVDAWRSGEFDIILMDIQMPEMDGLTATRNIRDEEIATGRARTPVVAVSANAMTHQVKEYLDAGMDGHVAKPIELMKLHGAMAKALEANAELQAQRAA